MLHSTYVRRFVVLILGLAVVAACGGHPQSFSRPGTMPMADRYSCAVQKINELGYTVASADRGAGLVRAQQEASGFLSEALSGKRQFRVLTVSIYERQAQGDTEMRVTAATAEEGLLSGVFGGGRETGGEPDDEAKKDARAILEACTSSEPASVETDAASDSTSAAGGAVTFAA